MAFRDLHEEVAELFADFAPVMDPADQDGGHWYRVFRPLKGPRAVLGRTPRRHHRAKDPGIAKATEARYRKSAKGKACAKRWCTKNVLHLRAYRAKYMREYRLTHPRKSAQ